MDTSSALRLSPLQHLASLTALVRALDALLHPADQDKLSAAARVQGSLPWFAAPAPILAALRSAIAEYAPAAGAVSADPWVVEACARLSHALGPDGEEDPTYQRVVISNMSGTLLASSTPRWTSWPRPMPQRLWSLPMSRPRWGRSRGPDDRRQGVVRPLVHRPQGPQPRWIRHALLGIPQR